MENERIGVWAATGVQPGVLDIYNFFGDSIKNRFPKRFINSYHYDTKTSFRSMYKQTRFNILKNGQQSNFVQQKRPRLTVVFDNKNNNQEDAQGSKESPFTYPLVQGVHPEMNGYIPIYKDPQGISLYMSHKRVRTTFEILVEVETPSDQENALAVLENTFKMQYGAFVEFVVARFILPNDIMETIFRLLYYENIKQISEIEDTDERNKATDIISEEFNKRIKEYSSNNGITPYYRNTKSRDKYYLYKQIYEKMYYEITSIPEKTDGERLGSIYSKYTVTMSGFFEFEKPISYILKTPEVICGNLTSNVLGVSGNVSLFRDRNPSGYMKFFGRAEAYPIMVNRALQNKFKMIYIENDITMDSPTDYIDICDWLENSDDKKLIKYSKLIKKINNVTFDRCFKILIYEDDVLFDERDMVWDGEILHLSNTDSTKLYTVYLLLYEDGIRQLLNSIEESQNTMEDK